MELHHTGHFGGGPKEFTQPEYWGRNEYNDIFIYDLGLKVLENILGMKFLIHQIYLK